MKILVFSAYFFPHCGGVEQYINGIYEGLSKKGIQVDILTCNTEKTADFEIFGGFKIYRFDCWHLLNNTYPIPKINKRFLIILKTIKNEKYNFICTYARFYVISLLGYIFAKIKRIKLIHTELGSQHTILSNPVVNLLSKIYDHTVGSLIVKGANINIGNSRASGEFIKHLGAKNYNIFYNSIDTEICKKKNTSITKVLGLADDYRIITFLGRLIEAKGVQDLISVFNDIRNKFRLKLLIVGEGNFKNNLANLASKNNDVVFLGEKNKNEIVEILSITDVFVNPSYSEGLPMSVMEAGACSCPLIATDVGGTREIIDDGINGFLIKPKDRKNLTEKLTLILENKPLANKFSQLIRIKMENIFSHNIIADKYYKFLTHQ